MIRSQTLIWKYKISIKHDSSTSLFRPLFHPSPPHQSLINPRQRLLLLFVFANRSSLFPHSARPPQLGPLCSLINREHNEDLNELDKGLTSCSCLSLCLRRFTARRAASETRCPAPDVHFGSVLLFFFEIQLIEKVASDHLYLDSCCNKTVITFGDTLGSARAATR